ncbi:carboxypeptidase B-like [Ostrea edulis]|uniref:carboxypeptidase B-like n=1 Tax=Ostrea edulis TaxID=37623 RepID=UPI0024AF9354|nr:carboxypeptidase B-like [Ostrea edulis]XP_048751829.2 carboxypeptidase B-like [Ostrea edulis]
MWTKAVPAISLIGIVLSLPGPTKRYDGHSVLQILPKTIENVHQLIALSQKYHLDIWKSPRFLNDTFDVRVDPEQVISFVHDIESLGLKPTHWIKDVQKLIDEALPGRSRRATSFNIGAFNGHNSINTYLDSLSTNSRVSVHTMGHSYEGRTIKYVKISNNVGSGKKAIYADGGIHAREWLAVSTVLYMIDQMANNPSNDRTIEALLGKFDFYFAPVVNPDGYEYSRSHDRMWRKNRRPVQHGCTGVDLNRNFAYHWNPDNGGSHNPCEEVHSGTHAASEVETKVLQNFLCGNSNFIAYLNIHTYGQYWIYPWGYTPVLPADYRDLDHLGRAAATAIRHTHGTTFTVGEDTRVLYAAAGGADDYAKGACGVKYSYTVELRDTGRYGFVPPSSYIAPAGEETFAGFKAFATELVHYEHL